MSTSIPPSRVAIAGTATPTREWYGFFQSLQSNLTDDRGQADVSALDVRVSALEKAGSGASSAQTIRGIGSVIVNPGDIKTVTLAGDSDAPGASMYYGTDASGVNGFYPLALTMALDDLTDVAAPSPSDKQVLTWDATAAKWMPKAVTGGADSTLAWLGL